MERGLSLHIVKTMMAELPIINVPKDVTQRYALFSCPWPAQHPFVVIWAARMPAEGKSDPSLVTAQTKAE